MLEIELVFFNQVILITPLLYYATLFIFGLFFGSFFKVIVDRSRYLYEESVVSKKKSKNQLKNLSWISGRSCCDYCHKQLAWYDNIPLLSFLWLGGKCRYCQKPINPSHPMTEFFTGILFILAGYIHLKSWILFENNFWLNLLFILVVCSTLWLIFLFDQKYMIIPDELVVIITLLAIAKGYESWRVTQELINIPNLATAFVALIFFVILRYLPMVLAKKYGMGLGDIKLIFPLAYLLGYQRAIVAVFCAFIIGGVWGIILLINKKAQFGQVLSFGPFLVFGSLISIFWGLELWQYYWKLL